MSWKDLKPTLKQLDLLARWGVKPDNTLTRGEAALFITEELARSRVAFNDDDYVLDDSGWSEEDDF